MKFSTLSTPRASDLFADVDKAGLAERTEQFDATLAKAFKNASSDPMRAPQDTESIIEGLKLNKSLSADVIAGLDSALAAQRGEINKQMVITDPLSTGFAAFDLEPNAKLIFPKMTPLVNKIARKKGIGLAHRAKVLTGITGSGTGGNANIHPGITESTTNSYGGLTLHRGKQITQSALDLTFDYSTFALGNSVSFDAQDSAMGFDDLRSLAVQNTIYAMKLMEERMFLYGRGTGTGYKGALAAPVVTLGVATAAGSQVALANATYYVYVTSDAGAFGESVLSTVASQATTAQVLTISVASITGAVGYKVYVGTTTGAANAHYLGRITSTAGVVNGLTYTGTLADNLIINTTGTLANTIAADTSAYAAGYDGIMAVTLAGNNVNNINSAFSTTSAGIEVQAVLSKIWDAVKGDPDAVLWNGADRLQMSNAFKNGTATNYRMEIQQSEVGGFVGGLVMSGMLNGITGKMVDFEVNPWIQQGVAPVVSYTLPIPDSNVSDVWAAVNVVDYRGTQWPVIQRFYDNEVSLRGLFMCYAPDWNGVISGIKSA